MTCPIHTKRRRQRRRPGLLKPADLARLRTRGLPAAVPPSPPEHLAALAAEQERQAAVIRRVGAICQACRARLDLPAIPRDEFDTIDACAFAALPACRRRAQVRQGTARCPLGLIEPAIRESRLATTDPRTDCVGFTHATSENGDDHET